MSCFKRPNNTRTSGESKTQLVSSTSVHGESVAPLLKESVAPPLRESVAPQRRDNLASLPGGERVGSTGKAVRA
jgi:hypothetical protein